MSQSLSREMRASLTISPGAILRAQDARWREARGRLLVPLPKPPAPLRVAPAPRPTLVTGYGWPPYQRPVVYDAFIEGETWKKSGREIALEVARERHVLMRDIRSDNRCRAVVLARHEICWRCREETDLSLMQIGQVLGGKDHTTVLYGVKKHQERLRG